MELSLQKNLTINGISVGSAATSLWLQELNTLLDIGKIQFYSKAISSMNVLLSHGHMDHAASLPYYLAARTLFRMPAPNIYVHPDIAEDIETILKTWQKLDHCTYNYKLNALEFNTFYPLKTGYSFQATPVIHRVPAVGYTIYEDRKKLKLEYQHLAEHEICHLRHIGTEVSALQHFPLLSYTGDCTFESFQNTSIFHNSKYLFIECTFWNEKRSQDHAKRWGHIHWKDICENPQAFCNNEKVILIHYSPRYSIDYINKLVQQECPENLKKKIIIFS